MVKFYRLLSWLLLLVRLWTILVSCLGWRFLSVSWRLVIGMLEGKVTYLYFVNIVYGMVEFYRLLPWLLLLVRLWTILVSWLGWRFLSGFWRLVIGMLEGKVTYLYFVNIVYGMVEFYRLLPWLLLLVRLWTILVGSLGWGFLSGPRRLMIGMLGGLSWSTRYMTRYWLLKNMFYTSPDEQKNLKNKIVINFLSYIQHVFWVLLSIHNICFGWEISQII